MNANETRQPCVYGLKAGGSFGYVGATQQNPKTRLWEHRSRARAGHPGPVYVWMREVGIENVEIVVLEANISQEVAWIVRLLEAGEPLRNEMSSDGVGYSWSASSKEKLSEAKAGKATWIKGKKGEAAGWSLERRAAQAERIRRLNQERGKTG